MRKGGRSVTQFPYVWVGALSDGGQREIIIVLLRRRPILTAVWREREREDVEEERGTEAVGRVREKRKEKNNGRK